MKTLFLTLIQVTVTFGLVMFIAILLTPVLTAVLIFLLFYKLVLFALGKIHRQKERAEK